MPPAARDSGTSRAFSADFQTKALRSQAGRWRPRPRKRVAWLSPGWRREVRQGCLRLADQSLPLETRRNCRHPSAGNAFPSGASNSSPTVGFGATRRCNSLCPRHSCHERLAGTPAPEQIKAALGTPCSNAISSFFPESRCADSLWLGLRYHGPIVLPFPTMAPTVTPHIL